MPERRLCRAMLTGLDVGRSSAMNKWVADNGKDSAIFAVCVMFWLLMAFGMAMVAVVVQLTAGPPAGLVLWVAFGFLLAVAAGRYVQSAQARRRFRESAPDAG